LQPVAALVTQRIKNVPVWLWLTANKLRSKNQNLQKLKPEQSSGSGAPRRSLTGAQPA
jgi:hypothetical protein